jgi:hypothetical protein
LVAAAFAVRSGTGTSVTPPPATVHRDTAAAKPVAPAPPVVAPALVIPKKIVDSAALARRRARRDSIKLANATAAAAAAAASKPGSVQSAIYGYARAIESQRVDRLREAYPNLPPEQQESWEKNFFARASKINASVRMGAVAENDAGKDTTAEADFTLHLKYDVESGQQSAPPMKYHATLAKRAKGWQIIDLKPR